MPELPDITIYLEALDRHLAGSGWRGRPGQQPVPAPDVRAAAGRRARQDGPRLRRLGKRIVIGLDGELWLVVHLMIAGRLHWKPAGPGSRGRTTWRPSTSRRHAAPDGSRDQAAGLAPPAARRSRPGRDQDPGGLEVLSATLNLSSPHVLRAKPHAQAGPDRPAPVQRDRQRLFRRDPPPRPVVVRWPSRRSSRGRRSARLFESIQLVLREWIDRLRGDGRRLPREGHRLPPRDGRARPVRRALPGLRHPGAADPLRRQRDQLLPRLPDQGPHPRRPLALATAQGRLAEDN